jgi:hypothetical protein
MGQGSRACQFYALSCPNQSSNINTVMKTLLNVEKSAFRPNQYVGYDNKGHLWRIKKEDRHWVANKQTAYGHIKSSTLTEISSKLNLIH